MLDQCESHNINRLKPWVHRIVQHAVQNTVRLFTVACYCSLPYLNFITVVRIIDNIVLP